MAEGFHVSWLPSYGPEMRGGTAHCSVNISESPVGSPLVSDPSVLVALNRPSLEKFERDVAPAGVIIYDSSLVDVAPTRQDVEVVAIPVTEIANRIGSPKVANMVALGAFMAVTRLLASDRIARAIRAMTKKDALVELNLKAVDAGARFVAALRDDKDLWGV